MANVQSDGTSFKQDLQGVGKGVDALKADVNNIARGAADAARSGAAEIRQGAQQAMATAHEKIDGVKAAATDAAADLTDKIARNPITSVGIAAGVGIVIGMLMSRPKN